MMHTNSATNLTFTDYHPVPADFYEEIVAGLNQTPKRIAPKFFYDARGSQLFEAICDLPEYYPTRIEKKILMDHVDAISKAMGPHCCIIEPGSGSSDKVRLLLDAVNPRGYMPLEISKHHLLAAMDRLTQDFPWLDVHAVCIDFTGDLTVPDHQDDAHRVAFFPGSSIGNFEPVDAMRFLRDLRAVVGDDGGLLIGVDLKKDEATLNAAYNDAAGVTADFNKNLLVRINAELDGDFDLEMFRHWAFYNADAGRIEMHLVSECAQAVRIGAHTFSFSEGETIHTENSYKYTVREFQDLARATGFRPVETWTDTNDLFSLQYFAAA